MPRPPLFKMPYGIDTPPIKQVLRWKLGGLFRKRRARVPEDDLRPRVRELREIDLDREEDFVVWLGHATFLIQMGGVRILTDPVFGAIPMTPRLIPFPVDPGALKPDVILISHGHYDHLDLKSLASLGVADGSIPILLPSGLARYLKRGADTTELGWYEQHEVKGTVITSLPASHWHRRGARDFNRALWCSFLIEQGNERIYFAGDSALDGHFEEIHEKVRAPSLALMPIGAYLPEFVMRTNHMNPDEAVEATRQLGTPRMIPYHYGTFKLSDEPVGEPEVWIKRLASAERDLQIDVLDVGEITSINIPNNPEKEHQ